MPSRIIGSSTFCWAVRYARTFREVCCQTNPTIRRRYREHTLILETDFETPEGAVTLVDFMPLRGHASDVARIECPVAEFNVSIVCEPVEEKRAPASQAHCRVCLQYTLAEALFCGRLGRDAYEDKNRLNPEILALARTVDYHVDPEFPGPGRFKGAVKVTLKDGRVLTEVEEFNRGSAENPMTGPELRAKFDDNASDVLTQEERDRLAHEIGQTENLSDVSSLVGLAVGGRQ